MKKQQYDGEGEENYKGNKSDEKLRQHGGEWSSDIMTGTDRTTVKTPHVNDYPGYQGPGEKF